MALGKGGLKNTFVFLLFLKISKNCHNTKKHKLRERKNGEKRGVVEGRGYGTVKTYQNMT